MFFQGLSSPKFVFAGLNAMPVGMKLAYELYFC